MQVKIWGARGSIPTPIQPEDIREKIITAMLGVSQVNDETLRHNLTNLILGNQTQSELNNSENRDLIGTYLDQLSPLAGGTASGNTACVEVRIDNQLFIIDAGSGIRELGQALMKGECGKGKGVIHLLFSHPHWDHIQGFPFFRPAFVPGNQIHIYGVHDMETVLRRQQEFINFPVSIDYMAAEMHFHHINPSDVLTFDSVSVRNLRNDHPGDAYSFRFEKGNKSFVYASDAAFAQGADLRPHLNFFTNADLLIFDTQFTQRESDEKEDWGHSSSFFGVEMAQQAQAKTLLLYHYDPTYSDKDLEKILDDTLKFQRNQYPNQAQIEILIAKEQQEFDLTPSKTTELHQISGGDIAILKPKGVFNNHVATDLAEQVHYLAEGEQDFPSQLIIDMSQVELLQVAGLRALVKLRKLYAGSAIVLAAPSPNVEQLIELAGYIGFFAIYNSVQTALDVLQTRKRNNLPGQLIKNQYKIEHKIGDGRLGAVFKATNIHDNQVVAIKVLSDSFSEGAIEQFLEQARQLIALDHGNIANIFDCDEEGGISFMIEEFVDGSTLNDLLNHHPHEPLPLDIALGIAERIAEGLEYAHSHNVTHGDLKPKNVLLGHKMLKISDFGLGRLETGKSLLNLDVPLALVTAEYLAPEQVLGHPIDGRTDIYALGIMLYQLFTGKLPFEGTGQQIMEKHLGVAPTPLRQHNPRLSPLLEHFVLTMLEKDPNKRYRTARQIRQIIISMKITPTNHTQAELANYRPNRLQLIDRAKPLRQLHNRWHLTEQGEGQFVFLIGEDGFGKTSLLQLFASHIKQATILLATASIEKQVHPYQPIIEAVETYLKEASDKERSLKITQLLQQIVNVLPYTQRDHTYPPINPGYTSLKALLKQATEEYPCLLIFDDVHWADTATLHLLNYLAHCSQEMRLMIAVSYCHVNVKPNASIDLLLSRYAISNTIALARFNRQAVHQFLTQLWSADVPAELVNGITKLSQGNPLYVEQIAQALMDDQRVCWQNGTWVFNTTALTDLPQTTAEIITQRVNRLNKEIQTLLAQASVLGHRFSFTDLSEISYLPETNMLDSIDVTLERQFIKADPSHGILCFNHPKIQEMLYHRRSMLERRRMHYEAGEVLERVYLDTSGQSLNPGRLAHIAPTLAYHFSRADDPYKVIAYSRQAAKLAQSFQSYEQALAWYTLGIDALNALDETPPNIIDQKFTLHLAREEIYKHLGQPNQQSSELSLIEQLLAETNPIDQEKLAKLLQRQAAHARLTKQFAKALAKAKESLTLAQKGNNRALRGESLLQLGYIALAQGEFDTAHKELDTAYTILAQVSNPEREARALNGLGMAYHYQQNYILAEQYYQQSLTLNRTHRFWNHYAATLNNLGALYLDMQETTKAQNYSYHALEVNQIIGHQRGIALCRDTLKKIEVEK